MKFNPFVDLFLILIICFTSLSLVDSAITQRYLAAGQTPSELSGNVAFVTNSSEHVFNVTNTGVVISNNQALNKVYDSPNIVGGNEGIGFILNMPSFTGEETSLDIKKGHMGLKITPYGNRIVNYIIFYDKINTYAWNDIRSSIDFADKDPTKVINQALDALPNGGVVMINAGTYTISGTIFLKSNVTLEGRGWDTILKMAKGASIDMIKVKDSGEENIVIRNLQIDGNRVNQDQVIHQHGILILEASNLVVDHVLVNHIAGTGITIATATPIRYNHALINSMVNDTSSDAVYFVGNRGIVSNNILVNWNDTGVVLGLCRDCVMSNNNITGISTAIGNDVAIISNSTRVVVLDNMIKNSPHHGIVFQKVGFLYAGNKILISRNQILNNLQSGISMGNTVDKNYGVIINNNEITNNTEYGILVTGNKTSVTNNLIEKNRKDGVFLYNAQDTLISGNIIKNNGWLDKDNYGVEISGDLNLGTVSTLITGNYIFDDQVYKTQKFPINTEPASSNTTIIDNWYSSRTGTTQDTKYLVEHQSNQVIQTQILSDLRMKGDHIPSWVTNIAKWFIDGELTQQEFENALKYLDENGFLK